MKLLWFFITLISHVWLPQPTFSSELDNSRLELAVGEQKTMALRPGTALTVSNPKSLKVLNEGGKLILIGKAPGEAWVSFSGRNRGKTMAVVTYGTKLIPVKQVLDEWLRDVYGISVEMEPGLARLKGTALRMSDWTRLNSFLKNFPKVLVSDVRLSDKLAFENPNAGHTEQLEELELKPMVEIDITIAEMKKAHLSSLGLQLPGSYSATVLPASDLTSATTAFDSLGLKFNAMLKNSVNKVLANPKLLCRSGDTAHFVAGGEIPIRLVGFKTQEVVWKNYGVILDITPLADMKGAISTTLKTEVSLLDEAHKVDGIPGLLTNRIETHFDLRGSKTIALSGLIKSEIGRGSQGPPILSQIPIIGELFKSADYQNNHTELVVFVTPRVISPENPPKPSPSPQWDED